MIQKNIFCYRLRVDDIDMITKASQKYESIEIKTILSFDDLMDGQASCGGLCLFIEEQTDLNSFESILKNFSHLPISVILKYKDFDFLMLCLKYKVANVFEGKLNEKFLENYLIHVDLSSRKETTNLPVN